MISQLGDGECVRLGMDCYGASVHRSGDRYWQTTPAVGDKPIGYRDVVRLDPTSIGPISVYRHDSGSHRLTGSHASHQIRVEESLRRPPARFMWQWCTNASLALAQHNQWWAYAPSQSAAIEDAFQSGLSSARVNVGLRSYTVTFSKDGEDRPVPYARQVDDARRRSRWVRRAPCTARLAPPPSNEPTCALCCESFEETREWPWLETPCGHVFHAACITPCLLESRSRCPLCRSSIESMSA